MFCLARFDDETKESFMDLYTKIDEQAIVDDVVAVADDADVVADVETAKVDTENLVPF